MKLHHIWGVAILSSFAALTAAHDARAQNCQTNQTDYNGTGTAACSFYYTNTTSEGAFVGQTSGAGGGAGVLGYSNNSASYGVVGAGVNGANGINGTSDSGYAGQFTSATGNVVYAYTGTSSNAEAIYGYYRGTGTGNGVKGLNGSTNANSAGVYGDHTGAGAGVHGESTNGYGGLFGGAGVEVESGGSFVYNGTCVAGACSSDERLKRNIEPLTGALDRLLQLKGVTYEWKDPAEHESKTGTQTGFIAQEVEKVFPGWVEDDRKGFKGVFMPPMQLAALEVEAFRALKAENDATKAENTTFRARLDRLENGQNPDRAGFTYGNGGWGVAGLLLGASIVSWRRRSKNTA
jgi:hypothetical protein